MSNYHFTVFAPNNRYCSTHGNEDLIAEYFGNWSPYISWMTKDDVSVPDIATSVKDAAVTQAFANISTSEMMALASAAEAHKTVDSMRAILWRVFKIARNVRKLNFRAIANELKPKEVADRYMEARYALRPLIIDAAQVLNALEKERSYARDTFRGYAEDSEHWEDTVINPEPAFSGYVTSEWKRTLDYTVSARAGVLCDVEISKISTFGLDMLAETAWELVPFSFIVDWFTNVGDLIAAWTPNYGVKQRTSWVTIRHVWKSTNTLVNATLTPPQGLTPESLTWPSPVDVREELVLQRIVDPQLSTFPQFDLNLDMFKVTDLGIILKKVFS